MGSVVAPLLSCSSPERAPTGATTRPEQGDLGFARRFEQQGFETRPALPLITSAQFNGGLRYDESTDQPEQGKWIRAQTCVRLEDLHRRAAPGVLARFQILSIGIDAPAFQGHLVEEVLTFLTVDGGLESRRMVLVSGEWLRPYYPMLGRFGIGSERIVVRSTAEVMATGDGSGFFNPKGHPAQPRIPTVSVHYPLPGYAPGARLDYPLDGFIEIAELSVRAAPVGDSALEVAGIGIERVRLARGERVVTFEESRRAVLQELDAEAASRGIALPSGYAALKSA